MLAPDGALAGLHEARNQVLVRFIGITGHARPEILGHALEEYDFDTVTVLVALGMADRLVSSPETFVLPKATQRNIGVIAMKVFGHGTIEHRGLALHYSLGLPGVSLAIVGMDNVEQIDENLELAANIRALNEREEQQLVAEVRPLVEKDAEVSQQGESDLLWLHDTKVLGWQEQDEPVLVRY